MDSKFSFLNYKKILLETDRSINDITSLYMERINNEYDISTRKRAASYYENKKILAGIKMGQISTEKTPHKLVLDADTERLLYELNNYKTDLETFYASHVRYLWHMTGRTGLQMIRASRNCHDAFYNEILDAVFASSSYEGNLLFTARAVVGSVFVLKNKKCIFPENPFLKGCKLKKTISEYCISADGFEPTFDFRCNEIGEAEILFSKEWTLQKDSVKGIENQIDVLPDDFFSIYDSYCCTSLNLWKNVYLSFYNASPDQKNRILDKLVQDKVLIHI